MQSSYLAVVLVAVAGCGATSGGPPSPDGGLAVEGSPANSPDASFSSDGAADGAVGDSCGRYLACLLVTTPEAYGAAIQLYGSDAACWKTPHQAEGCKLACDSAFAGISAQCECLEAQCKKCDELPVGQYSSWEALRRFECDDGETVEAQEIGLTFERGSGRTTRVNMVVKPGPAVPPLDGTVACSGSFSVTGTKTQGAYSESWSVTLTPTGNGKAFAIVATEKQTFTSGHKRTCTVKATVEDK